MRLMFILLLSTLMQAQTTVVVNGNISIDSSLQVSWNASVGAVSYNIYKGPTGGPYVIFETGVTDMSVTDSTVAPKTQYCYTVTAVNSSGESSQSTEGCGTTP